MELKKVELKFGFSNGKEVLIDAIDEDKARVVMLSLSSEEIEAIDNFMRTGRV